jgi:hypothetical protein
MEVRRFQDSGGMEAFAEQGLPGRKGLFPLFSGRNKMNLVLKVGRRLEFVR